MCKVRGHGMYPRREQGTRKRSGGACESLRRGVNLPYVTRSPPQLPVGTSLEGNSLPCPHLLHTITRGRTRGEWRPAAGQLMHTLAPWTPLSPWSNLWRRNFPGRPLLADQASWMEAQHKLVVDVDLSSPARESRCDTSRSTVIVGLLPSSQMFGKHL